MLNSIRYETVCSRIAQRFFTMLDTSSNEIGSGRTDYHFITVLDAFIEKTVNGRFHDERFNTVLDTGTQRTQTTINIAKSWNADLITVLKDFSG